jgi:PAS domain S-box-containing protein
MSADWTEMRQLNSDAFLANTEHPTQTWLENYIPVRARETVAEAIQKAIETKSVFELEHPVVRADGSEGWTFSRAVPLLDAQGEVSEWLGVASDTTERRRAEAALRTSEERLRLSVESILDHAIFTTDPDGLITSWNAGAERVFGYSEAEIVGHDAAILFTPEDREASVPDRELQTAREQGKANDDRWHLRKGGERFFASGAVSPIWESSRLTGYVKIARDLTRQRQAEEEREMLLEAVKDFNTALEGRVSERTQELERSNVEAISKVRDNLRNVGAT